MSTEIHAATRRVRLDRERVLRTAIGLADEAGIDGVSMRAIAKQLDVVPMALYKHVAGKGDLLDGMIDIVVAEIAPIQAGVGWKAAMRERILSARSVLRRHPWAAPALESRTAPTPTVVAYIDSMIGLLRAGDFSIDLAHHALHALGSRLMGFSQELFTDAPADGEPAPPPVALGSFPHIAEMLAGISHDDTSVVGPGCDDQFEFEFALDLVLDGLERLRDATVSDSARADGG
jgi:AcrR family transcriptional regulator